MSARNHKIVNLAEVLAAKANRPDAFKAQKVNGRWRRARMSARKVAEERKRVLSSGESWEWDVPHRIVEKKVAFKGHKRDAVRVEREERIKKCMARMPELIAEYKANRVKKQKYTGLAAILSETRTVGVKRRS